MMAKSIDGEKGRLLRLVEERLLSRKTENEKKLPQETHIPYLPKDCISSILVRLPIESLQRSSFVCKPWYSIIKNPKFIDAHFHRSESVLIFLLPIWERSYSFSMASAPEQNPNTVSVESKLLPPNCIPTFSNLSLNSTKFSVQFLAIKNGKAEIGGYSLSCLGSIRATCNGLILLDNKVKTGGLVVMNPVTRKLIALPLGTLHRPYNESYGFALSDVTGEYKIVHLFRDDLGFVSCEILSLWEKVWKEVDGPSFGLFGWFGYAPISAIGALHWIPQVDRSDYIVSVEVHKELFHQIPLPRSCRTHDRIIEMAGALGFVIHEDINCIDIWMLKGLYGEVWTKYHSITVGSVIDMIPYFTLRIKGDIIFKRDEDGSLYAYDFQQQDLTKVEIVRNCMLTSSACLPHVNSLISWMDESSDMHE